MKLTKKQKRAVRQNVYKQMAAWMRGQLGTDISNKVYKDLPDDTEALLAVKMREYAMQIMLEGAASYESLTVLTNEAGQEADGPSYDHPDTPPAHHPDTGADA